MRTGERELSTAWGGHEEPGIDMFSGLFGGFDKGKTKAHLRLGPCGRAPSMHVNPDKFMTAVRTDVLHPAPADGTRAYSGTIPRTNTVCLACCARAQRSTG